MQKIQDFGDYVDLKEGEEEKIEENEQVKANVLDWVKIDYVGKGVLVDREVIIIRINGREDLRGRVVRQKIIYIYLKDIDGQKIKKDHLNSLVD